MAAGLERWVEWEWDSRRDPTQVAYRGECPATAHFLRR